MLEVGGCAGERSGQTRRSVKPFVDERSIVVRRGGRLLQAAAAIVRLTHRIDAEAHELLRVILEQFSLALLRDDLHEFASSHHILRAELLH